MEIKLNKWFTKYNFKKMEKKNIDMKEKHDFFKKILGRKEIPPNDSFEFPEELINKTRNKLISNYDTEISKDQVVELLNLSRDLVLSVINFEFVTKDDLKLLETNLQNKFEQLISNRTQWYKTKDLEDLFGISKGKQQQLRNSKELPFTKIGNTVYYSSVDIDQILEANKSTL